MATNDTIRGNTETPPNMGQEMALVLHQGHSPLDDGSKLMGEEELRFVLVGQQPAGEDPYAQVEYVPSREEGEEEKLSIVARQVDAGQVEYIPLRIVRPESQETSQERRSSFLYEQRPKITITYTRRRMRPASSHPAKSKIELKPALFDRRSGSKAHKDANFEPSTPKIRPSLKRKRGRAHHVVKDTACDRALKIGEKLPGKGPSFVKEMLHSHVVKGFWLGLPAMFCRDHLLDHNSKIALEDEKGHTRYARYKAPNTALSGGWGGFAKHHRLKVGDVLVFKLIAPTRFKVYIIRGDKSKEEAKATRVCTRAYDDDSNDPTSEEAADELPDQDRDDHHSGKEQDEDAKSKEELEVTRVTRSPGRPLTESELYKKVLLERALAVQQMRAIESRISFLKDVLKEIDEQMEEIVEGSRKDHAFRKLATAPW